MLNVLSFNTVYGNNNINSAFHLETSECKTIQCVHEQLGESIKPIL